MRTVKNRVCQSGAMTEPASPSLRQRQAEETKAAILRAARALFADRGYEATSVADIAALAGVAVPTVYKAVGTKEAIMRSMIDLISSGDGGAERLRALQEANSVGQILHAGVVLMTELQERFGDVIRAIRSAAGSAPEALAALTQGEALHRNGTAAMITRIDALGGLRPGLDVDDAARVANLLTSATAYEELVSAYGLSHAEAGDWLEGQLRQLLLRD